MPDPVHHHPGDGAEVRSERGLQDGPLLGGEPPTSSPRRHDPGRRVVLRQRGERGAGLVRLGIRIRRTQPTSSASTGTQSEIALAALLPILHDGIEETEPDQDEIEYAVYAPRAGHAPPTPEWKKMEVFRDYLPAPPPAGAP